MAEATQDHKDAQKAANVEDWQEKYNALTVTVNGATYQADSESISQMTKNSAFTVLPDGFYWLDSSNNQVTVDKDGLQAILDAALAARYELFAGLQTRKAAIQDATTIEELESLIG